MYLRITVDGSSVELSTKRKADSLRWSADAGRLLGKTEEVKEFNAYLDAVKGIGFTARRQLLEWDRDLSAEAIKNMLTRREPQKKSICSWRPSATTTSRCAPWWVGSTKTKNTCLSIFA